MKLRKKSKSFGVNEFLAGKSIQHFLDFNYYFISLPLTQKHLNLFS